MKSRTRLLLIAALLIAGAGLAVLATRSSGRHAAESSTQAHRKSAKSETEDGRPEREDRLAGVDPALKKIIRQLETSIREWYKDRPPYQHHALYRAAHRDFTRGKIAELGTEQIAALTALVYQKRDPDLLGDYQKALYFVWGSRDFAATRPLILKIAEDEAPDRARLAAGGILSPFCNTDLYESSCLGLASSDLQRAWHSVVKDAEDPTVSKLLDVRRVAFGIFGIYAATDPNEAWRLYLAETNPKFAFDLLYCYSSRASSEKDWTKLAAEFDRLAVDREYVHIGELSGFASDWLIDDPEQALNWFAAHVDMEDFRRRELLRPDEHPPDMSLRVKMQVMDELLRSDEYRVPDAVAVLQRLASGADEVLADRAVSHFLSSHMSPSDLPLLAVIPHFKSPQLREEIFLKVARAVPAREYSEERFPMDMTFDHPNFCLDAVRALAAEMDLPDEVREQAEAAFREVEAKEAERQEAKKRQEEQGER